MNEREGKDIKRQKNYLKKLTSYRKTDRPTNNQMKIAVKKQRNDYITYNLLSLLTYTYVLTYLPTYLYAYLPHHLTNKHIF